MDTERTFQDDCDELEVLRTELEQTKANLDTLTTIVNSSPAVVFLWRMEDGWPVEFVSESVNQFGYSAQELMSGEVSWPGITYDEDIPRLEAEVGDYLASKVTQFDQEYRLITKSGDIRWIEDRNIIIRDTDGQPTHIQGMIIDITERKRMETALRDSEAGLNEAQQLAGVGSWQWDLRTGLTTQSDQLLRIYGLPPDTPPEDVQNVISSVIHPDDRAKMNDLMKRILAGGEGEAISFRIIRPDGETRWLDATRYTVRRRDKDGRPTVIMGAIRDVTETRNSRIALQQSEEKYRAVVESAGEAICTLNADGVFLFMNNICAQRLGGSANELVGKTLWDVFPKEFADTEAARARDAVVSGKSSLIETLVPLGDEMMWYQISMEPVRDHDGEVRSALVFARDVTHQKQASEGLRESEAHLQAILSSLHQAAVLVYSLDGDILSSWTSRDMDERYGIDTSALPGKNLHDFYPPDIAEARIQQIEYVHKTGQPSRNEWTFTLPNGEFWVETTLSPLRDSEGNITSVVAFARDITERKQTEEQLRQSEQRYKALFEGTSEGILVADVETHKYLFANPAICEMMKYSLQEFLEMNITDCHPPEDLAHVISCFEAQSRGEYRVAPNIPFQTRDGEVFYADVSAALIKFEGRDCAVGFIHDLTEARLAAEQLRQSKQRYRMLFEGASEGILVADIEESKLVFSNPAVRKMLKYSEEELLEMHVRDCHRPEDIERMMIEFEALARGEKKLAPAIPFLTKNGEIVYADVGGTVMRIEGRNCLVGFLRDLTDARRAEEALKTAHVKLMTARDEERKHIASELHDSVSQKLVALGMQLENSAQPGSESSAARCNELISDIRSICHGLYPPALEVLGLVSSMKQFEDLCRAAGLTAEIHYEPRIATARFSPEVEIALFRIAQEAVSNAIRHSGATTIDIDLIYAEGQLVLAVLDDGEGFDVQAAAGTGFGLGSMRDRARAVGARLTIDSEHGETRIEVSAAVDIANTDDLKGQ